MCHSKHITGVISKKQCNHQTLNFQSRHNNVNKVKIKSVKKLGEVGTIQRKLCCVQRTSPVVFYSIYLMSIDERLKTLNQPKPCSRSQRDLGIRIINELIRYTSCSLGEHILTMIYVTSEIRSEIHKISKMAWKKLTRYILILVSQIYY